MHAFFKKIKKFEFEQYITKIQIQIEIVYLCTSLFLATKHSKQAINNRLLESQKVLIHTMHSQLSRSYSVALLDAG